ncbi:MAG: glutamate 5-kinase [Candidatus Omnitrophica bacterium]|nr:glutamate 5-kinase [Candidatus Omnitrophota bacterium]
MKKIVVKIGSSVIAPNGKLDSRLIGRMIKDIVSVEKKAVKVVLVSSGAIACGMDALGFVKRPKDTYSLMAISSFGQILLMDIFNSKCRLYNRRCAQILLTWDDFDNRNRYINIRRTIDKLLDMGIIPIINENDAVASEEIGLGDNDRISAFVANLLGADDLIILSDVEGLLKDNILVKQVEKIDFQVAALAKREDKTYTKGGMIMKLEAARIAASSGVRTTIASGRKINVISLIAAKEEVGTLFLPAEKKDKARKRWISFSKKIKGLLVVDSGAKNALVLKGKSLLNVGVIKVEGTFNDGDAVLVVSEENCYLGCGISAYSAEQLKQAKNKKLEKEVIHRDNFVKASGEWCYYAHLVSQRKLNS